MSVEAQKAQAELIAAALIAQRYGDTADSYNLTYEHLRDLIALGYLTGAKDALTWAERLGKTL